jgi:MFS family permease
MNGSSARSAERPAKLPRTVFWLGVVSLATDASSDMIYPLLPMFLTSLGASAGTLGGIEGAAEGVAALLKMVSGRIADRAQRRKPLTVLGYAISSTVRPLAAFATAPWHILAVRLSDRVGKGVRSSPRDALVADATPPDQRGRAYGFHRAMDNAGAVIGPLIATALLVVGRLSVRHVFLVAAIPGVIAMLSLLAGVVETEPKDKPKAPGAVAEDAASPGLARYLFALGVFSLGNASDAFILLRARQLGVAAAWIPTLWMLHNLVKALLSTPAGALSDQLGRRRLIFVGWAIYAASYLGFGLANAAWHAWALMAIYGVYYALSEGTEKAMVADLAGAGRRGRAFGTYYAVVGLSALPASFGFGVLVDRYGARLPFTVAAALAAAAATLLALVVPEPRPAAASPPKA